MAYIWPFPDGTPISQPFGSNPSNGFNPSGGHTGTDFAVGVGTPVMAISDGTVVAVGQLPEPYTSNPWWIEGQWAGNVVIIDHGPVLSVYAHLSEWRVNLGDNVTQGQVIALSGATGGASTGPHCHFETIPDGWDFANGTYGRVNPNTFCTGYWDGSTINTQSIPSGGFLMELSDIEQRTLYNNIDYIASAKFKADIFAGTTPEESKARRSFHTEALNTPVTNVKTGGTTTPATEIGWTAANFANIPGNVLNANFKLADGTVTNLAGILAAIHATPVTVGGSVVTDPQAIADAVATTLSQKLGK